MILRRTIDAIRLRRKPRCERCHARGAVRRVVTTSPSFEVGEYGREFGVPRERVNEPCDVDVGGVSWVLCARCEQETSSV